MRREVQAKPDPIRAATLHFRPQARYAPPPEGSRMGSCTSRVVLVGLLALAAAPAGAQSYTRQQAEPAAHAVEISPFAGLFWSMRVNTSSGPVYLDPTWDVGATLGFAL